MTLYRCSHGFGSFGCNYTFAEFFILVILVINSFMDLPESTHIVCVAGGVIRTTDTKTWQVLGDLRSPTVLTAIWPNVM